MNIVIIEWSRSWHVSHRALAVLDIIPSLFGCGFRSAMERDDLGDGAQTQPLAVSESGSGCFVVVAQSLAVCLVQAKEPSAAASVGESYVFVDAKTY